MIQAYFQDAEPTQFFTGMFRAPRENFYSSQHVEYDIVRGGEEVAIAVQDLSAGHRNNATEIYTNKQLTAPIYKEAVAINSWDLLKRRPGNDPFEDPAFLADATAQVFRGVRKIEQKIRRSIELQGSQILQTGTSTLVDTNGDTIYSIDFKPKATHFVTAGTAWNAGGADILGDILAMCGVVRQDGKVKPDQVLLGEDALEAFLLDADIQARYDGRRLNRGDIRSSRFLGEGEIFHGTLDVGNYKLDIISYDGRFDAINGGANTQYLTPANAIIRASTARMDATFGNIPNLGQLLGANRNLMSTLPSRMSGRTSRVDLHLNTWLTSDGETLMAGVGARPLLIPTAIDTFGRIATGV